jgi:hypothetical protein
MRDGTQGLSDVDLHSYLKKLHDVWTNLKVSKLFRYLPKSRHLDPEDLHSLWEMAHV